jgi:hypothetical protein
MDAQMPGKDRDESTGEYTTTYPDEDFIAAVNELGPAAGTQDIADTVGCDRDTAYRRLRELEDADRLDSRKVGMARLWSSAEGDE